MMNNNIQICWYKENILIKNDEYIIKSEYLYMESKILEGKGPIFDKAIK
jgi:hypothetical protein